MLFILTALHMQGEGEGFSYHCLLTPQERAERVGVAVTPGAEQMEASKIELETFFARQEFFYRLGPGRRPLSARHCDSPPPHPITSGRL